MHLPKARLAALALLTFASAPAAALPLISEVLYDADGSDDGHTFVELFGAPGTSLDGLTLEGVNGSNGDVGPRVALTGAIPADGLFVVADQTGGGTSFVAGADLLANFDFQNGPDAVRLVQDGSVLDAVGYGEVGAGEVFAGEGGAAPDPPAGWSVARLFADVDTDDNAADFVALELPTPGAASFAAVPEPGSAIGMAVGLAGLALACRRRSAL
jgi:hypothetical protein